MAPLKNIPLGTLPDAINVIIEIPQGSSVKYELDKKSGAMFVDRFIHTAMVYPFNYGFIPQTKADDGDPMDVMLISAQAVIPGAVVPSRPIGMLEMEDESGIDTKILAVPAQRVDPWYAKVKDAADLDDATRENIKHFFSHYKELEPNKWVKIKSILGKDAAVKAIRESMLKKRGK